MVRIPARVASVAGALLLFIAASEVLCEEIRWGGGFSPNMVSAATNLPADPGSAVRLWELNIGSHQYSIPTLDRGRLYIGANDTDVKRTGYQPSKGGALSCVDQATGRLLWQLLSPRYVQGIKPPLHFDQWGCGICSGPVIDGNRVYVIGNRGDVLCLDREGQANGNDGPFQDELAFMGITNAPGSALGPTDGDILWRYNLLTELDAAPHDVCGSTPLLQGDFLYACTSNGLDDRHAAVPRPLAPSLIVLDKNTGRLMARDDEKIGQRVQHGQWSSPSSGTVNGQTVIFFGGGDGILYAFEPPTASPGTNVQHLKRVWSYDCNPPDYRTRDGQHVRSSNHIKRTPDGPSEIIGTPVFHEGRVYVAIGQSPLHGEGQGCLSCVDAATGVKVWDSKLVERSLATPAIANGLLYLADGTGTLHCFDTVTGERYWTHPLGAKTWGASAFVADGKVYVGTEAKVFWVFQAGKTVKVLSKTRLQTVPITPAAADGVLYLPTQTKLAALVARPEQVIAAPGLQ